MVDELIARRHSVDVVAPPPHYPSGTLMSPNPEDQAGAVYQSPKGETIYRSQFRPHTASIASRILDQATVALSSVAVALRVARRVRPDIILATAPPLPTSFTSYVVSKVFRVPVVIDLRDVWPELTRFVTCATPRTTWKKRALKAVADSAFLLAGKVFNATLRRADGIITTSSWHAKSLKMRLGVRTYTLANDILVDLTVAPESPKKVRPPELHVLYTGNVGRAQGLENAIEAVRLAAAENTNVILRFIGGGAHLNLVKELASDLPNVEFVRPGTPEALKTHHEWADTILVHLKGWPPLEQTVPSKVFSAIGSGRHVTLAANGESVEILRHADVGDAVPAMNPQALADLWVDLARNPERLEVGSRGIEWLRALRVENDPGRAFVDFLEDTVRRTRDDHV